MQTLFWNIFNKRINVETYVTGIVFNTLFAITILIIFFFNFDNFAKYVSLNLKILMAFIFLILEVLISASLSRRRQHDLGKKIGIWEYNSTYTYDLFRNGQKEENRYGKPPKPGIDFKTLFGF